MRRLPFLAPLAFAVTASVAVAAAAEAPPLPAAVRDGIARLNYAGMNVTRHCSATQIGRRAALAMTYCIKEVPASAIHLLFGYDRSEWAAHRKIASIHPDRDHADLSLLCLDADTPNSPAFEPGDFPRVGDAVVAAGYPVPASHRLTTKSCAVATLEEDGAFSVDCTLGAGAGGGPVFAFDGAKAELHGVVALVSDKDILVYRWTGDDPDKICSPR